MAADFFVVPTATGRSLFVLVMLAHHRRRVVHLAVTAHPTAAWTAQQLREAFPWDDAQRYLIRDRDLAFAAVRATAEAMAITEVLTALRSPWQNGHVERFIGSVRRECFDHVIVFNADGLRRVLKAVHRVPHEIANSSVARKGPARTTSGDATGQRASDRHSSGRRTPSPVRTSSGIVFCRLADEPAALVAIVPFKHALKGRRGESPSCDSA